MGGVTNLCSALERQEARRLAPVINQHLVETDSPETDSINTAPKRCIGIFARAAQLGHVKTRIAAQLGDEAALAIYKQLLSGTLERAAHMDATLYLWATDTHCDYLQSLAAQYDCQLRLQVDGDLGERMQTAMEWMLSRNEHAVLIGSDCPVLTARRLEESFAALEHADVVLTPAEDGGFVLIAATSKTAWSDKAMFSGVRWSTERALGDTLNCLHDAYAQVTILDRLWDVDTAADVSRAIQAGLLQRSGKGIGE